MSWVSHRAVCKKFGLHVGRLLLAFLVLSAGMFCSSAGESNQMGHFCLIRLIILKMDDGCNCCIPCWLMCVCVCVCVICSFPPQYVLYVQYSGSYDWLVPGAPQSGCAGYCSRGHSGLALQCPAGVRNCQ